MQLSKNLLHLREELKNSYVAHVYALEHVNSNHWIVHKVSLTQGLITSGDSLHTVHEEPWPGQKALKWFLEPIAGEISIKNSLPIGKQIGVDYTSCGICVVNVIEHTIFGKTL